MEDKKTLNLRRESFPVEAFPQYAQDLIYQAQSSSPMYHPDLVGSIMLYALSVAIGNSYHIGIKDDWIEPAMLYLAVVASTGKGKTPTIKLITKPLAERNTEYFQKYLTQREEYSRWKSLPKKEREKADTIPNPVLSQLILKDATTEGLIKTLAENQKGVGLLLDELPDWYNNVNKYNRGSDAKKYLSLWSGESISSIRKDSEANVWCQDPFTSILGGIQESELKNFIGDHTRSADGTIQRFLYAFPDTPYFNTSMNSVNSFVWDNVLNKLLDHTQDIHLNVIRLSEEALRYFISVSDEITELCNDPQHEPFAGFYQKLKSYLARISLILHVMEGCSEMPETQLPPSIGESIEVRTVQRAKMIIEYFLGMTHKILDLKEDPTSDFNSLDRTIWDNIPDDPFNKTDLISAFSQQRIAGKSKVYDFFSKRRKLFRNSGEGLIVKDY